MKITFEPAGKFSKTEALLVSKINTKITEPSCGCSQKDKWVLIELVDGGWCVSDGCCETLKNLVRNAIGLFPKFRQK
ncbi:MAG: hypothetical protein WCS77_00130 [Elusimicrobiaceae bacterium]